MRVTQQVLPDRCPGCRAAAIVVMTVTRDGAHDGTTVRCAASCGWEVSYGR